MVLYHETGGRFGEPQGKRTIVKTLIGRNWICVVVVETRSRRGDGARGHGAFGDLCVSVGVIHVPGDSLSVARLHHGIPSDPGHYESIQQRQSLLTPASPWADLLSRPPGLTQHGH